MIVKDLRLNPCRAMLRVALTQLGMHSLLRARRVILPEPDGQKWKTGAGCVRVYHKGGDAVGIGDVLEGVSFYILA